MTSRINECLEEHRIFFENCFTTTLIKEIETVGLIIGDAIQNGNKVMFMGNGGSAADSQHLAAEFISKLAIDRKPLAAIAITTDTSAITAIGNDYGYEKVFERQVFGIAKKDDVLIGISTSGTSKNIINGFRAGQDIGTINVGLSGRSGFPSLYVDRDLNVSGDVTARIQEAHIFIGHTLCEIAESRFL